MFFRSSMSKIVIIIKTIREQLEINESDKQELEAKYARELNKMQNQIQNLIKMRKEDDKPEIKKRPSFASIQASPIPAQNPVSPIIKENAKSTPKKAATSPEVDVKETTDIKENNDTDERKTVEFAVTEKIVEKPEKIKKRKQKAV
jgi:transketolase